MLRPYKSFLARPRVIEGPDGRCRQHRRTAEDTPRAVAPDRGGGATRARVHRVRSRDQRAAAVRARCAGSGARGPAARPPKRRARNPDAREARRALSRHRGAAMVAPSRAPLRADRLRAVNEPRVVAVELNADGHPAVIRRSNDNGGGQETTAAAVEAVLETWRIDDEWWRQLISRRYFAVILEGGGRVVVFENLVSGEWFIQTP